MGLSLYFALDLRALRDEKGQSVCPDLIEFWARPFLEKEHRELMQAHFTLSEDERKGREHEFNVEFISKVAAKAPKGIPGFPEKYDDLAEALKTALGEKTEVNEMIVTLLREEHLSAGGNRYFFR